MVAVISGVFDAPDPVAAARAYCACFAGGALSESRDPLRVAEEGDDTVPAATTRDASGRKDRGLSRCYQRNHGKSGSRTRGGRRWKRTNMNPHRSPALYPRTPSLIPGPVHSPLSEYASYGCEPLFFPS